MRHPFLKGALIGGVGAGVVLAAAAAMAGTGIGSVFNLGRSNSVNNGSVLKGHAKDAMLTVRNRGSGTALRLRVRAGKPPFTVNSATRIRHLNADRIDGVNGSKLQKKCEKGAVLGYSWVIAPDGSYDMTKIPSTFTENKFYSFNCSGGKVLVRRDGPGQYVLHFDGLEEVQRIAIANVDQTYGKANLYANTGFALNYAGGIGNQVVIRKDTTGTLTDSPFMFFLLG